MGIAMKAKILELLNQTPSGVPVSGQRMSHVLGVSRVAVWKHIRQLQAVGYLIESTPKGYRLVSQPDTLHSWVFGPRAPKVHYYPELGSTMDQAMTLAREGCPHFTLVVTDRQTNGRGRLQRAWQSVQGGLYVTIVLRPKLSLVDSALVNLAAALDLAATLNALFDIHAQVKWPNDVLVGERKIAGILSQMEAEDDQINFINIGIGVNVNNDADNIAPSAVSIAQIKGHNVSRAQLLSAFWDRFEARMAASALTGVVSEWKQCNVTLGRRVRVQTTREILEGVAVDLDINGGLILETTEGLRQTIVYGDCFHQGAQTTLVEAACH